MKFVEIRSNINAKPQEVWEILTDARMLEGSDLGILKIDGDIALGEKIKLWSEVSPQRAFALKVTALDAPRLMVWAGGMPFGLFEGRRMFALKENSNGCELHMREEFTGLLASMIWKSMPDLNPSFRKFADGIKALAERKDR